MVLDLVNKPRENCSGGGGSVRIYIQQNHVIWKREFDLERDKIEEIVVEIMPKKDKSLIFFLMYKPSDLSKYLHSKFNAVFPNQSSQLSLKEYSERFQRQLLKTSDNCKLKSMLQLFRFAHKLE